ncbi:MAG: oligosaccharide flippase family protein, partial [Pseudomonadota bacterium]|nr:oligosaccharide flippase family protein [Pseudomonadota bacterium]
AYPAALFFAEARLEAILYVLAGAAVVQGFENIGVVAFRKDLEFSKEFNYRVLPKIISFVATVALAIAWKSYWALIAGIVIGQIARIVLSYVLHPYRPSLSVKGFGDIMGFSKWLVVNSMLNFVNTRGDTFIVAKLLGPAYVGIYNIAYEISNLVTTELTFPIQRAIFPGYARIAANRDLLIRGYLKVLYLTVAVACPLGIGIALLADPLVRVCLGDNWLAAIPIIQILGFAGVFRMFSANNGPVYLALGKPWIVTWLTVVNILAALPLMAYGIYLAGLYGAAWGILLGAVTRTAMNYFIVVSLLGVTWGTLARVLWRTIAATAALAIAIELLLSAWPQETLLWSAAKLAAGAAGGGIVYLLAALGLWYLSGRPAHSAEAFYLEKLEARLGGIRCLKPFKA